MYILCLDSWKSGERCWSPLTKPCTPFYPSDVGSEKGLTLGLFSFRLVFAKLKLLMIAIEYKSEKRESRYVLRLEILTFWNALWRILPASFLFFLIFFSSPSPPPPPNEHSYSCTFETFQSIISMPSYCTISYGLHFCPVLLLENEFKLEHLVEGYETAIHMSHV